MRNEVFGKGELDYTDSVAPVSQAGSYLGVSMSQSDDGAVTSDAMSRG